MLRNSSRPKAIKYNRDEIIRFIRDYWDMNHYGPGMREIMHAMGIGSTSHVSYILNQLQEEGRVVREPGVARSIRVLG